jgi:hypothetical protein
MDVIGRRAGDTSPTSPSILVLESRCCTANVFPLVTERQEQIDSGGRVCDSGCVGDLGKRRRWMRAV